MADFNVVMDRRFEGVPRMRLGTVTAVSDADGLDVAFQGGAVVTGLQSHRALAAPEVGDVVVVCSLAGRMWVMDALDNKAVDLGANLVSNPGLEFGTTGGLPTTWTSFWSTITSDPNVQWVDDETLAHSSGAAVQFTPGLLSDGQTQQLNMLDSASVEPGMVYRVAAWFRGTSVDPNTTIKVNVHTAPLADDAQPFGAGVTSFDVATLSTTPDGWTELSGLRTIPVGHYFLRVFLVCTANAGHTVSTVYADDVSLRQQI